MAKMSDELLSKIRLKDTKGTINFKPFKVDSTSNSLLKPIIEAFENSDKVKIGYTTLDKSKGVVHPTLKRKTIYLTGGALRDHLKGKTFKHFDLATDATPDEIMLILKHSETPFKKVSEDHQFDSKDFVYYPSRHDSKNNIMEITVQRGRQKAYIATFNKNNKNRLLVPTEAKFVHNIDQDAYTRDLTINALYLKLKNSDGENSELSDPVGGAHDLKIGEVTTVEDPAITFKRDHYLPFRLADICCRFSNEKKIPERFLSVIKNSHKDANLDGKILKKYYVDAIENLDVSPTQYLKNLQQTGLLNKLFPNCNFANIINDLPNSKILTTAYLLHPNNVDMTKNLLLTQGYTKGDVDEIGKFMKLAVWCSGNTHNTHLIQDLLTMPTRLPHSKIYDFLNLFGKGDLYHKVFKQDYSDVTKKYIEDESGEKVANPKYISFLGKSPDYDEINIVRKNLLDKAVKEKMNYGS
jgi:tRNA nucleotidyltransferase/poly(A) polymerase